MADSLKLVTCPWSVKTYYRIAEQISALLLLCHIGNSLLSLPHHGGFVRLYGNFVTLDVLSEKEAYSIIRVFV